MIAPGQVAGVVASLAIAGLVALAVHQRLELFEVQAELATERTDRATERAAASKAAFDTALAYRNQEREWSTHMQESANEFQRLANRARDDGVRADAARVSLLDAVRNRAAASCGRRPAADTAVAGDRAPAEPADDVLADVFGGSDAATGILAKALDAAYASGKQCERDYDTVSGELGRRHEEVDRGEAHGSGADREANQDPR